jgi:LSD1 subclass zinc finger protein
MTSENAASSPQPDTDMSGSGLDSIACSGCGAPLAFAPGTTALKCNHCGAENSIATTIPETIIETDFRTFLADQQTNSDQLTELHTIACSSCGASTTLAPNTRSDTCPFCGSPIAVAADQVRSQIRPRYLLPFSVTLPQAQSAFRTWITKRWFAPNDLKRYGQSAEKLAGIYIPYWTYDSATSSAYTGRRGTNHTQSYSTVENGRRVTRTRTVIHWTTVSGRVDRSFDDVLVIASSSLPEKYASKLEPWDLGNLVEFNENFLAGFRTETYRIDLAGGFEKAKTVMDKAIRESIRRDIGGDHQQITSVSTAFDNITFKHILLPIWLSAYRYRGKVYRFMVNGRTGEVQGERPWSIAKITIAAAGGLALLAGAWYLLQPYFG